MKPTISELLAGAWPAYAIPPAPINKTLIWELRTDLFAPWGFPQGCHFVLQETELTFAGELALVRIDYASGPVRWEAGCLFGKSSDPYLVQPGKTITFAPTATYQVMGRLVPLEQYQPQPFNRN